MTGRRRTAEAPDPEEGQLVAGPSCGVMVVSYDDFDAAMRAADRELRAERAEARRQENAARAQAEAREEATFVKTHGVSREVLAREPERAPQGRRMLQLDMFPRCEVCAQVGKLVAEVAGSRLDVEDLLLADVDDQWKSPGGPELVRVARWQEDDEPLVEPLVAHPRCVLGRRRLVADRAAATLGERSDAA
jgi:hypothetical protein